VVRPQAPSPFSLSSNESVLVIHTRNVRITCPPSCAHSILPSLEAPRHRDVPRDSQALCDATSTKWAQDPVSVSLLLAYLLSHTSSRENTQRCSAIHRASPLSWSLSLSLSLSLCLSISLSLCLSLVIPTGSCLNRNSPHPRRHLLTRTEALIFLLISACIAVPTLRYLLCSPTRSGRSRKRKPSSRGPFRASP